MTKFHRVLEPKESVLWEGKPRLLPYILDRSIPFFFMALIWIGLVYIFIVGEHPSEYDFSRITFLLLPHMALGVILVIAPIIYSLLSHDGIEYLATDKRILIRSGLFGEDFESIEYDEIAQTKVDIGLRDILSDMSGTVFLHGKYRHAHSSPSHFVYTLHHVDNPYEVFKLIEKVSRDFKTEMKYPNKYRPRRNKGFKTKYKEGSALET